MIAIGFCDSSSETVKLVNLLDSMLNFVLISSVVMDLSAFGREIFSLLSFSGEAAARV